MNHVGLPGALLFGFALLSGCGGDGAAASGSGGVSGSAAGTAGSALGTGGQSSAGGNSAGGTANGGAANNGGSAGSSGSANAGASAGGTQNAGGSSAGGSSAGGSSAGGSSAGGSSAGAGGSGGGTVDPSKKITVWLAGDSTMQLCSSPCPCGWGSQFQSFLSSNATVVDSGAGGRSIQTWLYDPNVSTTMQNGECVVNPKTYSTRWQAMLDPNKGMKPGDYLFIEFGINDTDSTCNRHVGSALFQSYLGMMAQAAKDRGAQAILLTSTSYMQCSGNTVKPNRAFGPETQAAGKAAGVPVIDLTALSAALYTSLGLCPNAGDFTSTSSAVGKFFCDDHTHFEAAGAQQIAGVVAKALRDQNIGLAAYLK